MRGSRSSGLATLARWREFQESRSAMTLGETGAAVDAATSSLQHARDRLDSLHQQHLAMLQRGELDLARLQVGTTICDLADLQMLDREAGLEAARAEHAEASGRHVRARAHTRLAETRYLRVATAEAEHDEKTLFDWMADLHSARRPR